VQRAFSALRVGESKLLALWDALWRTGVFVYVPRSVEARVPVWAAYSVAGDNGAIFPATLAVLDDNASLTPGRLLRVPGGDAPVLSSAATLMWCSATAPPRLHNVQQWGAGAWHFATHRAVLGRNARLRLFGASLGGRLRRSTGMRCSTDGSEAFLLALLRRRCAAHGPAVAAAHRGEHATATAPKVACATRR